MRIAAFQRAPLFDDPAAITDMLVCDLDWAETRGVDLALFPECVSHGHAYDWPTIQRRASTLHDEALGRLLDRLAGFRATLILGLFERCDGIIRNSAIVVEHGRIAGIYAKAHPNEDGVTAGHDFPLFGAAGWRFGINICNDANHPDAAQAVSMQGADLICYPLNNLLPVASANRWRERSVGNLRDRARQTGCWIAAADVAGRHGTRLSHGCMMIVRPDGTIAARAREGAEDVALFDLPRRTKAKGPGTIVPEPSYSAWIPDQRE